MQSSPSLPRHPSTFTAPLLPHRTSFNTHLAVLVLVTGHGPACVLEHPLRLPLLQYMVRRADATHANGIGRNLKQHFPAMNVVTWATSPTYLPIRQPVVPCGWQQHPENCRDEGVDDLAALDPLACSPCRLSLDKGVHFAICIKQDR
jgi:hypothetical protein